MNLRFLSAILLAGAWSAIAQTGGISGTVTSAVDGSPVPGATVIYHRLVNFLPNTGSSTSNPQLAPGEVYFSTSSTTDAKGGHSVDGLPPGTYQVCINSPNLPFLDPCKWGEAPLAIVAPAQISLLNIAAAPGVYLQVTINDVQGLLPTSESGLLDFPHLTVGVYFGSGAFLAARRSSVGTGIQTYSMAVPTGVPLNLWLISRYVYLSDSAGNALATNGAKIPFTASAGTNSAFTINVTGSIPAAAQAAR